MLKKLALAAVAAMTLILAAHFLCRGMLPLLNLRALAFVTLYTFVLVLMKYSPGRCMYRIMVLNEPERHLPIEIQTAQEFVVFAGTRLLFAGLIFTLVDVANVLAANWDVLMAAGALSMALSASLYALILYVIVSRAGYNAARSVGPQAGRQAA